HAAVAGGGQHLVHARGHDADPLGGDLAVVVVPHVADDDRSLGDVPVHGPFDDLDLRAAQLGFTAFAEVQAQDAGHLGAVRGRLRHGEGGDSGDVSGRQGTDAFAGGDVPDHASGQDEQGR